jgi:voltage-gated potassium channel Kch
MSLLARLVPDSVRGRGPREAEELTAIQGRVRQAWGRFTGALGKHRGRLLAAAGITAFVLGYVGACQHFHQPGVPVQGPPPRWSDFAYLSLQNFVLNNPLLGVGWPQGVARFLAPAVAGYAGLVTLAALFRDQLQQMRIARMRRHVIVCGLGDVGYRLVRHLRDIGERVVVVEADATNPHADVCRRLRIPVIVGDAQSQRTLAAAGVHQAARLVAACQDDVVNTQISFTALELTERRGNELRCLARIADPELCALLRILEAKGDQTASALDFFNIDEISARGLLNEHSYTPDKPHILVAHLEVLGQWLIWHAARDWFARRGEGSTVPLVVTVVDDEAKKHIDALKGRYPALRKEDVCRFIECTESYGAIRDLKGRHAKTNEPSISRAYVTAYHDHKTIHTALKLRHALDGRVPLVAAMWRGLGLATLTDIDIYPTLDNSCTVELVRGGSYETIAEAIHKHYLEIQSAARGQADKPWQDLQESFRESSRDQARHIAVKLGVIGCKIEPLSDLGAASFRFSVPEVEALAAMEHDRWAAHKKADGWKKGDQRDDDKKLNPWLVPWNELPEEQKKVDRDFVLAIPSLLASVGVQITRISTDKAAP